jgi:hypothetical protein
LAQAGIVLTDELGQAFDRHLPGHKHHQSLEEKRETVGPCPRHRRQPWDACGQSLRGTQAVMKDSCRKKFKFRQVFFSVS